MEPILNVLGVVQGGRPSGPQPMKKHDRSKSDSKSWSKSRGHKGKKH